MFDLDNILYSDGHISHIRDLDRAFVKLRSVANVLFGNKQSNSIPTDADLREETEIFIYNSKKLAILPVRINNNWIWLKWYVIAHRWAYDHACGKAYYTGIVLFSSEEELVIKRLKDGSLVKKWSLGI